MELSLERFELSPESAIGSLVLKDAEDKTTGLTRDERFVCYTLEDAVREITGQAVEKWKIPGRTAIPRGRYKIALTHSQRFNRILPLLCDVPGFTGVRMHAGNTDKDTEGCLLVGQSCADDAIYGSGKALEALMVLLQGTEEEIFITIS